MVNAAGTVQIEQCEAPPCTASDAQRPPSGRSRGWVSLSTTRARSDIRARGVPKCLARARATGGSRRKQVERRSSSGAPSPALTSIADAALLFLAEDGGRRRRRRALTASRLSRPHSVIAHHAFGTSTSGPTSPLPAAFEPRLPSQPSRGDPQGCRRRRTLGRSAPVSPRPSGYRSAPRRTTRTRGLAVTAAFC